MFDGAFKQKLLYKQDLQKASKIPKHFDRIFVINMSLVEKLGLTAVIFKRLAACESLKVTADLFSVNDWRFFRKKYQMIYFILTWDS